MSIEDMNLLTFFYLSLIPLQIFQVFICAKYVFESFHLISFLSLFLYFTTIVKQRLKAFSQQNTITVARLFIYNSFFEVYNET